jgi:hypothetical protein
MAALAMDVYSRGYNAALADGVDDTPTDNKAKDDGLGKTTDGNVSIGQAKVFWSLKTAGLQDGAVAIGLHAIAYQMTQKVMTTPNAT